MDRDFKYQVFNSRRRWDNTEVFDRTDTSLEWSSCWVKKVARQSLSMSCLSGIVKSRAWKTKLNITEESTSSRFRHNSINTKSLNWKTSPSTFYRRFICNYNKGAINLNTFHFHQLYLNTSFWAFEQLFTRAQMLSCQSDSAVCGRSLLKIVVFICVSLSDSSNRCLWWMNVL